jgi:outer membrane lipoprotein-sorting protein
MTERMSGRGLWWVLAVAAMASTACAQNGAAPAKLNDVLKQMDASAANFQSAEATISVDNYTAVVQDHSLQKGTMAFRRESGSMEMVTHLKDADGHPAADVLYQNGKLDYYNPGAKQETIFSAGANRGEFDSLLATGFGATGKELASAWTVTYKGMETMDGTQTARLELVSKDPKVRSYFSLLTIWVDLSRDITLKQVMLQPDGDSRTATYSDIRYNRKLDNNLFRLAIAPGTQVQAR